MLANASAAALVVDNRRDVPAEVQLGDTYSGCFWTSRRNAPQKKLCSVWNGSIGSIWSRMCLTHRRGSTSCLTQQKTLESYCVDNLQQQLSHVANSVSNHDHVDLIAGKENLQEHQRLLMWKQAKLIKDCQIHIYLMQFIRLYQNIIEKCFYSSEMVSVPATLLTNTHTHTHPQTVWCNISL